MDKIITLAKSLIAIPSVSNETNELNKIFDLIKEELKGFEFREFKSEDITSLFYSNDLSKRQKLILNAHLDVVPGKKEQFVPVIKDNKIYGRGAYDMKSAAAVMIILFKELSPRVDYPLGLQLVTDEEIGGLKGTKFQIENGVDAEFVIAGENTNLKINNLSKGIIWLKLKTRGKAAHGAYPWFGENAIWKMNKALSAIEKIFPELTKEQWVSTINLSNIETSNKAFNKVPDECTASLDIRFIPEDGNKVIDKIKDRIKDFAELEITMQESSHKAAEDNDFINKLKISIKEVTGNHGETIALHGASDMRFYTAKGIPAVTFGPRGGGHHSDSEWVDLKSLEDYYKILNTFLGSV